jgi:hypothetical protein
VSGSSLTGGFNRWLYLLDEEDCLRKVRCRIKTALWFDDKCEKWQYVSIFPSFIKSWYQPCLNLLEYVSCEVRKGEDVLEHIDDPEELLLCEDRITGAVNRLQNHCAKINCEGLLNSKYTHVFNRHIPDRGIDGADNRRFPIMHSLIVTARYFFGESMGVIALMNTIIHL